MGKKKLLLLCFKEYLFSDSLKYYSITIITTTILIPLFLFIIISLFIIIIIH